MMQQAFVPAPDSRTHLPFRGRNRPSAFPTINSHPQSVNNVSLPTSSAPPLDSSSSVHAHIETSRELSADAPPFQPNGGLDKDKPLAPAAIAPASYPLFDTNEQQRFQQSSQYASSARYGPSISVREKGNPLFFLLSFSFLFYFILFCFLVCFCFLVPFRCKT